MMAPAGLAMALAFAKDSTLKLLAANALAEAVVSASRDFDTKEGLNSATQMAFQLTQ